MTNPVAANQDSAPAEVFQTLSRDELSDLGLPTANKGISGGPLAEGLQDHAAVAVEGQEAVQTSPVIGRTIEVSEAEGIASAHASSTPQISESATLGTSQEAPLERQRSATSECPKFPAALPVVGVAVVILIVAAAIGFYARPPQDDLNPALSQTESISSIQVAELQPNLSGQRPSTEDDHIVWEGKLREVDALHQRLMAKREELLRLKQNYHYGVLELEEEAAFIIKAAIIDSLPQALKNKRLELVLQSIQRRQAYRNSLDKPLRWIDSGSEYLLYLERRTILDNQMKEIVEYDDISTNMSDINSALTTYEPTTERLLADNPAHLFVPIETIWKRVSEQAKTVLIAAADPRDEEIVAEICAGNLVHLNELTKLTLKAARCLAESGAMDLFMSHLNRVSPVAVQKLAEWPGEWLCLNGLERLSPESAKHFFRWPGQRISLNRLSDFPAESAAYLVGWQGRQLELMGLNRTTGIEFLSRWEASGGQLFVPENIRKQIEEARHR